MRNRGKAKDINALPTRSLLSSPKAALEEHQSTAAIREKSDDSAKPAKDLSKASNEVNAAVAAKKALGKARASCHKKFRADKCAAQ